MVIVLTSKSTYRTFAVLLGSFDDGCASITKQVRVEEERSALAGFEALFWWWIAKNLLFGSEDKEILGFHPLLLDTRWSNVYQVADDDDDDDGYECKATVGGDDDVCLCGHVVVCVDPSRV